MRWWPPRTPGGHLPSASAGRKDAQANEDLSKIAAERERLVRDLASPPVEEGSRVRVRESETGEVQEYEIAPEKDRGLGLGRVSVESPVGKALLGRRAGQFAEVFAPSGQWRIEVLEVVNDASAPPLRPSEQPNSRIESSAG